MRRLAKRVDRAARAKLGRSLSIRHIDAGSCNGCELEIHALNNAFYDLERLGLRFVASPRHADILTVTGPVTRNMREALLRTYNATPDPKWVVAIGTCAADGGPFAKSYAVARRGQGRSARRSAHPRLPPDADRDPQGPGGADGAPQLARAGGTAPAFETRGRGRPPSATATITAISSGLGAPETEIVIVSISLNDQTSSL